MGGWKVVILKGNPPDPDGSTSDVMNDGNQLGFPQMYGQLGTDGPPSINQQVPFLRNQFQEITIRVEVRGAPNAPESRITWWRDGLLCGDWPTAKILWDEAARVGMGQFQLLPYETNKDATQDHPTGYMWFDDHIISTQPIMMATGVTSQPPGSVPEPPEPPDPPVNTAPTITIKAPTEGQALSGKTLIDVVGSDDLGVALLEVLAVVAGSAPVLLRSAPRSTLSFAWNTAPYKGKTVAIEARATDADGLKTSASVTVTVKK